jgi:hypothetical protein
MQWYVVIYITSASSGSMLSNLTHCGIIHTQPNRSFPINVMADFFMRHQD